MARTQSRPLLKNARLFTRQVRSRAKRKLGIKPKATSGSVGGHLRDPKVRDALLVISNTMHDTHRERVMQDLHAGRLSPLSRYVIYMAFLESVSPPVRPLALHPKLGDWLLRLPDDYDRYYPADPCWDCGYNYPGTAANDPAARTSQGPAAPHPWVGGRCLYCGGEIVNHLEWLGPDPKRTLSDFQNAPYRLRQQSITSQDRRLDAGEAPANRANAIGQTPSDEFHEQPPYQLEPDWQP